MEKSYTKIFCGMKTEFQNNNIIAIVPVRAGSRGLPGKNTLPVNGLPLYMHAVNQGLRTVGKVLLSTDIKSIANVHLPNGCTLCWRPPELSTFDTPMVSVIQHLIEDCALSSHRIVLLQATSPLRLDGDILAALKLFSQGQYDLVMSVVKQDSGVLKYGTLNGATFRAMREQNLCFANRQQLPTVHGPNGAVYVFEADHFTEQQSFPSQRIGAVEMPKERSVDIDTMDDLLYVEEYFRLRSVVENSDGNGE